MSDLEFLKSVRLRLQINGWQKRELGPVEGPNCLLGAAMWTDIDIKTVPFEPNMIRLARLIHIPQAVDVAHFNDAVTYEAVMQRLDRFINLLEEQERKAVEEQPEPALA